MLVSALREEVGIPVHFHTHDTAGSGVASVLAAAEAGVDAADAAMDPMSGLTSPAQPGRDRRGAAGLTARHRPRARAAGARRGLLGGGPLEVRGLRERHAGGDLRGLRARDARRPVHEPAPAGAGARDRVALARGGPGLRRRQPDVRRHRQGDADLEGGRRPRRLHGHQRPHPRAGARPGPRDRLPGLGRRVLPRRPRPALRGLPGGAPAQGAARASSRCGCGPARSLPPADLAALRAEVEKKVAPPGERPRAGQLPHVPEGLRRLRRAPAPARRRERAADAGLLLRARARRRAVRGHRARQDPGRSASWRSARPTRRAGARSSSSSTASRAR